MSGRSTAVSKLTISTGAGIMAAAALGAIPANGMASDAIETVISTPKAATSLRIQSDFDMSGGQSVCSSISYPITEEWNEATHKDELRRLIVKKASQQKDFTTKDAKRLAALQQMRRETLPQAMSYEEFVREQDRMEELMKLTEALMVYERKYGATANG